VLARSRASFLALVLLAGCGGDATTPAIPHHLEFSVEPSAVPPGVAIAPPVQVAIVDSMGNTVRTATSPVTMTLAVNPAGGTLTGTTTVSAINGVATFSDLKIDQMAGGYSLAATAGSLPSATSADFPIARPLAMVSAGGDGDFNLGFSCAISLAGAAYCWGYNGDGALGTGSSTGPDFCGLRYCSKTLAPVTGGLTFASVRAGLNFACGVTTAGAAYCWGVNTYGQLGDGTTTSSAAPVLVAGGLTFSEIAVGYAFACGVTTTGTGYCWGWNRDGQLGNGTTTGPAQCFGEACSTRPVPVAGGLTFKKISVGYGHGCAITPAGAAYCWGYPPLGDGTSTGTTAPVAIAPNLVFAMITVNMTHQCGVTTSGLGYCWGFNGLGQLGDGTNQTRLTPVRIAVPDGFTFATLSTGDVHTCGTTPANDAYCWGYNSYGALGNGSVLSTMTPTRVFGQLKFSALSAGAEHTCGITTSTIAYCWGHNEFGELGHGTSSVSSSIPLAVLP
jgi:alpha-tubulin suppressor-like RCC1 family protein